MEFRILGPLEVVAGGTSLALGGPKAQAVLGTLLLTPNAVVATSALVESVWDQDPPARAVPTLHAYVSRLRGAMAKVDDGGPPRIENVPGGYRVRVRPGELDAQTFRDRVRNAEDAGDVDRSRELLRSALGLWRGAALMNVPGSAIRDQAGPLDEARLLAHEKLAALELERGRHAMLVPQLRGLNSAHPTREHLAELLMLALYRCGSQADALDVYRCTRQVLVDDLGLEPGPGLRRLHQRILGNDPALRPHTGRHRQLPRDVRDFTGRGSEIRRLSHLVLGEDGPSGTPITVVDGVGGSGKTALAVHVGHRLAEEFADGQMFLDLQAHSPGLEPLTPFDALGILLGSAGVDRAAMPDTLAARAARWRTETGDRHLLLVLDDVADTAQIRPLLPGGPRCSVLITSRDPLADLEGAQQVTVGPLPPQDASALFSRILGGDGPGRDTADIPRACGYLPVAIRVTAARLRRRPARIDVGA
ncbi:BTAD domain-containing putative transcriptional regulator [Amycolatopsis sp. CA-128772]|uniref:AfsR/SARP family transcriptional regulator n=1 Tax=Amycolatopsis sp. CA-128772 TaxID=2073159 RepID=UPI000CD0E06D|nr:BTAD domain-containing putative transcriptional regulator [Amycolatopsis sp. CA-128772]